MFEGLTPEKEKRVKLACIIVIALLVPAFVVYYEYEIAAANNIQQMKEHALVVTGTTPTNMTIPNPTQKTP